MLVIRVLIVELVRVPYPNSTYRISTGLSASSGVVTNREYLLFCKAVLESGTAVVHLINSSALIDFLPRSVKREGVDK